MVAAKKKKNRGLSVLDLSSRRSAATPPKPFWLTKLAREFGTTVVEPG